MKIERACDGCGADATYICERINKAVCSNCWLSDVSDKEENECVYCEGVADFQWLDGGWYVCTGCIKEGKTDTQAQGDKE